MSRSKLKETLTGKTYQATGVTRKQATTKKDFEVSAALRMVQTIVGGIGVCFPSIMHHPSLVAAATRAHGLVGECNHW